jgi:hypothetical protein
VPLSPYPGMRFPVGEPQIVVALAGRSLHACDGDLQQRNRLVSAARLLYEVRSHLAHQAPPARSLTAFRCGRSQLSRMKPYVWTWLGS